MDPAPPRYGTSSQARRADGVSRRALTAWAFFALSLLGTGLLVWRRGEDLSLLRTLDSGAIVALVLLQGAYLVLQSGRFHVVLRQVAPQRVPFWPWLQLFVLGRFLNLFVPQGGNVYRGVVLKRRFAVPYTRFVTAFVNAPWIAMVLNFALGALLVTLLTPRTTVAGWPLGLLLGLAALIAAAAPLLGSLVLPRLPRGWRWSAWAHARVREVLGVTLESLGDARYLWRVSAWTVAAFGQAVLMLWVCFAALGTQVGLAEAVAFYVLLQLATYLTITPGNLGVQELAFGFLAVGLGSGAVDGVLVSALLRVTGVIALVALALPLGGMQALRASRSPDAARPNEVRPSRPL